MYSTRSKSPATMRLTRRHRFSDALGLLVNVIFVTLTGRVAANNGTWSACQTPATVARSLAFTPVALTLVAPLVPQRLMSSGWSQIPTVLECAHQTLREFPHARGYLYNEVTGLCTPVLYIASPNQVDAREVVAAEGALYLASEVCGNEFQIYALGEDFKPICLKDIQTAVNFDTARKTCGSYGGFLTPVKTAEKLEFLKNFTSNGDRWVGLDDIDTEGVYVWHSDGSVLTLAEQQASFSNGEPNDHNGNEDCTQLRSTHLNDFPCSGVLGFVCEIALPSINSTC